MCIRDRSTAVLFCLTISCPAFSQDNKKTLVPNHTGFGHVNNDEAALSKKNARPSATKVEPEYIGTPKNEVPLIQNRSRRNRTIYFERIETPKVNKPE
jgi:hypothetical protein